MKNRFTTVTGVASHSTDPPHLHSRHSKTLLQLANAKNVNSLFINSFQYIIRYPNGA